jgi:hypothetical protein
VAHVGVSITKSSTFRDAVQEFSNVYYYQWSGLNPTESLAETLIDRVVELEKPLHGSNVTFVRGRCWSAGGTKAENNMIFQKALTGAGTGGTPLGMDKERAYLIRWRAGVDSRGKPVYLRKWFHCDITLAGASVTSSIIQNATGFSNAQRTSIAALFNNFNPIVFSNGVHTAGLVSSNNRPSTVGAEAHKYLEHHQLGDAWRS